ncbi:MAG: gpW family protein [Zoogloea sp.]|nr:gpW family protein [Zoogloea sp.]
MADLETLRRRLTEAEAALHDLQTGKRKVSVSRNGTSIGYANSASDIANLKSYITDLKAQISRASGQGVGRRVIRNYF